MDAIVIASTVAILAFVAGIIGLNLQKRLPERHTSDRSRDMISAVNSLVTLVLALVLGTLISSGYSVFAGQKTDLDTLAAEALQLDMTLAQFGPEAKPGRTLLKQAMMHGYEQFWSAPAVAEKALDVGASLPALRGLNNYLGSLDPKTPIQQRLLASAYANVTAITATRLKMSLQLASTVASPLLAIIAAWSLMLFCGYGLLSRMNAMTLTAIAFGALAVGMAIFLIIELRQPYSGIIHVPSAGLLQAIDAMDQ
jgi:Protein of unknown function (DUF4239)